MIRAAAAILLLAAASAAPAARFVSRDGSVRLDAPAGLAAGRDFAGRGFMASGWRLVWGGEAVGQGTGIVRFTLRARPTPPMPGSADEMLQVGMSRDPAVVRRCATYGLEGGERLPDRMLGGGRWTAWRHQDAGMSQSIEAIDLRTVAFGACYAVARIGYGVTAARDAPRTLPTRAAAARLDAVLGGLRLISPRR